jgi:hypothetical protein
VRADGRERYVQNSWLRLSHRKLDLERSTTRAPFHTDTERAPDAVAQVREGAVQIFRSRTRSGPAARSDHHPGPWRPSAVDPTRSPATSSGM